MKEYIKKIAGFIFCLFVVGVGAGIAVLVGAGAIARFVMKKLGKDTAEKDGKEILGQLELKNGEKVDLKKANAKALAEGGYHLVFTADSFSALQNIYGEPGLYSMTLCKDVPEPTVEKPFVMEIPVTEDNIGALGYDHAFINELREQNPGLDYSQISDKDIAYACMLNDLEQGGMSHVSFLMCSQSVSNSHFKINQENYHDFTSKWESESQSIENVDIKLDLDSGTLSIKSDVREKGKIYVVEDHRILSVEETAIMRDRLSSNEDLTGGLSSDAKKGLVMMLHSDYFSTYRKTDGRALYKDVWGSFIKRKPLQEDVPEIKKDGKDTVSHTVKSHLDKTSDQKKGQDKKGPLKKKQSCLKM